MEKIPSLFERNHDGDRLVFDSVVDECRWVLSGEGEPTMKWDGTACAILNGVYYKRLMLKGVPSLAGPARTEWLFDNVPEGFLPAQEMCDPRTGKLPGWVPVGVSPDDKWHLNGLRRLGPVHEDGTYELVGPKIQGNPHKLDRIMLVQHGAQGISADPRTFNEIMLFLKEDPTMEGIVWHHPDGRMAKIKKRDFGIRWP